MIAAVSLLAILSIGYLSVKSGTDIITLYINKHLSDETNLLLLQVDRVMDSRRNDIVTLSNSHTLRSGGMNKEEIKKELLKYIEKDRGYTSLSFFDMNRVRLIDTRDLELGKQHDMVPYWEDVLAGKISAGRDVRIAEELHVPIIYFASHVLDYSGNPIGVVVARYNPEKIQKLFDDFTAEENEKEASYYTLIDKDKNVIFSSHPHYKNNILKEKIADTASIQAVLSGEVGTSEETDSFLQKEMVVAFTQEKEFADFNGNGWSLISVSEKDFIFKPIVNFKTTVALLGLMFFVVATFVGILYSRSITGALKSLVLVSEKVSAGNLNERAHVKSNDEFGYLAIVFNQMLDNIGKLGVELSQSNVVLEQRVKDRTRELSEIKENLEKTVEQRTVELEDRIADLEKFEKIAVDRELKMVELKAEIDDLKNKG